MVTSRCGHPRLGNKLHSFRQQLRLLINNRKYLIHLAVTAIYRLSTGTIKQV